jgi:hypothetical protein
MLNYLVTQLVTSSLGTGIAEDTAGVMRQLDLEYLCAISSSVLQR